MHLQLCLDGEADLDLDATLTRDGDTVTVTAETDAAQHGGRVRLLRLLHEGEEVHRMNEVRVQQAKPPLRVQEGGPLKFTWTITDASPRLCTLAKVKA